MISSYCSSQTENPIHKQTGINSRLDRLRISGSRLSEHKKRDVYKGDYEKQNKAFLSYLDETEDKTIDVIQKSKQTEELRVLRLPYKHRWTSESRKQTLAKFYKLETDYNADPKPVTFITLTTKQRGFDRWEDQFNFLRDSYQRLRLNIKYMRPKADYIWVLEPHKSGFIHMHMMIFCKFTAEEKDRLLTLWCDKYGVGVRQAQDIQDIELDRVNHIRTYLFKYLAKSWDSEGWENENLLTFHSTMWAMSRRVSIFKGMRSFGSSQRLSSVMRLDKPVSDEEWETLRTMIDDSPIYENKERLDELTALPSDFLDLPTIHIRHNLTSQYVGVPSALEPVGFESSRQSG